MAARGAAEGAPVRFRGERRPCSFSAMHTVRYIIERVETKRNNYSFYNFSQRENNALKAFFDLSQEFDEIEDFYRVCAFVPKVFLGLDTRLYLLTPWQNSFSLVAQTEHPEEGLYAPPPEEVHPDEHPYYTAWGGFVLTIRGKKSLVDQLPFKAPNEVLGLLEVYPLKESDPHLELFFEKYANRVGFNLHNRYLAEKNIEHLRFIRSLVADIEHNIIVPNMVYKLYLRRLKSKIVKNIELEQLLCRCAAGEEGEGCLERVFAELVEVNQGLTDEFEHIEKHYRNMSLFLETLLRRSHFDQGRLTLRTKPCNMKREVIQPQLERYLDQFKDMDIEIDDEVSGIPDEEVISVVDVGLIAQVYANLFSNALKYTREITTGSGERKKYISYGREEIPGFFGEGKDGVKYNVFSTGPHIAPEEQSRIFDEGFRGSNAKDRPGTGHGLAFIKTAVEIHGGVVGYEATAQGNNFYFILPK